jgi:hypothetical protein
VTGDFNGDGETDLAVTSSGGNLYIYLADYLADSTGSLSLAHTYAISVNGGLQAGDFNGDAKLDLITSVKFRGNHRADGALGER